MKLGRPAFGVCLFVLLGICAAASAGEQWSPPTKIISVYALGGANLTRLEVPSSFTFDPAKCGTEFIDVQLDSGRSAEEQRQIIDSIHAAFLTSRNIYFLIRDDTCSKGAGGTARLAIGVRVHAN